ncbi:MAG: GIY-YIG nuclease family protein [Deltaproteobacteria bacterium]|nr:GIY-YIG nuclease family protein [Deltaproteobacteria bacterium]
MQAVVEPWWVYIVECADGTLYTGVARDVDRRIETHNLGKGARYTRGRGPVQLRGQCGPMSHSEALKLEHHIKRLPTADKLAALTAG